MKRRATLTRSLARGLQSSPQLNHADCRRADSDARDGGRGRDDRGFSHVSSIENTAQSQGTTARSTTFCRSRMFPGQSYG